MPRLSLDELGRRERQIMNILFRLGRASATDVQAELGEAISNSAVRGMLRLLVSKGYVRQESDDRRFFYSPAQRTEEASRTALAQVVATFFRSSPSSAIAALLEGNDTSISEEEYNRLIRLLDEKREGVVK
jgi:BlaI family transcriptional regulator, penicillinase repressor